MIFILNAMEERECGNSVNNINNDNNINSNDNNNEYLTDPLLMALYC